MNNPNQSAESKGKTVSINMGPRGLILAGFDEMCQFATAVIRSGLSPQGFQRPEAVMLALQGGAELGMTPMQSLQNLIVIRGHVTLRGAAKRALVEAHPECEGITDNLAELMGLAKFDDQTKAVVTIKRKNRPAVTRPFSVADAKRAGLWEKRGEKGDPSAWITYPGRMLYWRALGWALDDLFGDVLRGFRTAEEVADYAAPELRDGDSLPPVTLDAIADDLETEQIEAVTDAEQQDPF